MQVAAGRSVKSLSVIHPPTTSLSQGLNAQLYYRNKDFREYISLIPTSAITGEGVPDILLLLVQLSQKMLVDRIMWNPEVQCTVLEVMM